MKRVVNSWLDKKYKDEIHIIDGIIISMLLTFFIVKNFLTLSQIYFVDLILLFFMLITIFLITILTIKNAIWHINDIQISVAFIIATFLTLFNNHFFTGLVAYWFFFAYFLLFTIVFFRNFIIKVYFKEKKISW